MQQTLKTQRKVTQSTKGKAEKHASKSEGSITHFTLVGEVNKTPFIGYAHKSDITNMPVGHLVVGSHNVLTDNGDRVEVRKGYEKLENPTTVYNGGIRSSYDFKISNGSERHLRGWQATATYLSSTSNTLTIQGTDTFTSRGFSPSGTVYINGNAYTYSGGANTTTLTGVSPDPTTANIPVGESITQASLQFYYQTINDWVDLTKNRKQGLFNFSMVWNKDEMRRFVRFVDGEANNMEWSGGITTFASATSTTITKQGQNTWAQDGFYRFAVQNASITVVDYSGLSGATVTINVNGTPTTLTEGIDWNATTDNATTAQSLATAINTITGLTAAPDALNTAKVDIVASLGYSIRSIAVSSGDLTFTPQTFPLKQINIGGTVYTYNGGEDTLTLTGVTPNPTSIPHTAGDLIFQEIRIFPNADIGLPVTLYFDLIATFRNQLYLASTTSNNVYVSAVDDFQDFTFSTPVRLVGEGDLLTMPGSMRAFAIVDNTIYMFADDDDIVSITYQLSSDLQSESFQATQLDTAPKQGAKSQSGVAKVKNAIIYVSNETAFNQLGYIEQILKPQNVNLSDPIKIDFDTLDFTDCAVIYYNYFIYIALPLEQRVLVFNIEKGYWEAPQILPISCFSIINGQLYGHSSSIKQTYKLFSSLSDDGNPIDATALFSYQNFGLPANYKTFNEYYVEGYISANTSLDFYINYEIDGCEWSRTMTLNGLDKFVCRNKKDRSFGKQRFGDYSYARLDPDDETLPPKFRIIETFDHYDFYEVQFGFHSNGVDQRWELLRFGPAVEISESQNVSIKN